MESAAKSRIFTPLVISITAVALYCRHDCLHADDICSRLFLAFTPAPPGACLQSFPLVAGLLASGAGGLSPMAALALAFGFGYMGMMLSPIHLCLLMTRDYFSASLLPIYRQLAFCVASQTFFAILVFVFLMVLNL